MENKDKKMNFTALYLTLGGCATVLILSGFFLPAFFKTIEVDLNSLIIKVLQISFIVSGIIDLGLLFYAKKKLS